MRKRGENHDLWNDILSDMLEFSLIWGLAIVLVVKVFQFAGTFWML